MIVKETVFSRSVFERRYCLRTKLVVRIQVYDSFATQTRFVLFVSEFSAGRIIFCLIFFYYRTVLRTNTPRPETRRCRKKTIRPNKRTVK